MKTLMTIIATGLVTTGLVIGGIAGFLFSEGNLKLNKVEENHNKVVMVDGQIIEEKNWTELFGYTVELDLLDSTYVGK